MWSTCSEDEPVIQAGGEHYSVDLGDDPSREVVERFAAVLDGPSQRESERRREPPPRAHPEVPPDQKPTFEELMLVAEWTRANPGLFVNTEGATEILGVSAQYVGRRAAEERLPWFLRPADLVANRRGCVPAGADRGHRRGAPID